MEMSLYLHFFFSFVATAAFGVLFQAPKRTLVMCGLVGAVGWTMYKYLMLYPRYSSFYANLLATIALSILAEIFSWASKEPSTIFIATGVIPLVPGLGLYKGMEKIISGNSELGMNVLINAGIDSLAIALGIMLVASIFHKLRVQRIHRDFPKINKEKLFGS